MRPAPLKRSVVSVALFALLAASCGQYGNVHEQGVASGETSANSGLGEGSTSTGGSTGTSGTSGSLPGSSTTTGGGAISGGTSGGTSATTGGTSSSGGGTTSGSGAAAGGPPSGGDTTGVTDTTITIGIHAPVTGAAPVRVDSFNDGKDLYWKYGNNGKPVTVHGRTVKVLFEDDHYNPSTAKQVCQKMAEQENAFLLIGGAGTDQIVACAQYAASAGIPYLSAGVTEGPLAHLSNYFAVSMTYPTQSVLLANYIRHVLKETDASKIAMVAEDTPNFDDAVNAFTQAFPGVKVYRPSKNENGSTMAANLCTGTVQNYPIVYPLVAPVYYLQMAKAAKCHPQYAGIGLTTVDSVANIGCPDTEGATFFNPAPAWHQAAQYDPDFEKAIAAAKKDNGGSYSNDDIVWTLWGLMKTLKIMLDNAGADLTRQGFIYSTERLQGVHTGDYPDLSFSPGNHFGANEVATMENVCTENGGYYNTKFGFRSSF